MGETRHLTLRAQGNLKSLDMLLPVVKRVHGDAHPELAEVARLYGELKEHLAQGGEAGGTLSAILEGLRTHTGGYAIPSDACPAFHKTYAALLQISQELGTKP